MINMTRRRRVGDLTEREGGLDGVRAELTKVRLEHGRVLHEDGRAGSDECVQSVEEDEANHGDKGDD